LPKETGERLGETGLPVFVRRALKYRREKTGNPVFSPGLSIFLTEVLLLLLLPSESTAYKHGIFIASPNPLQPFSNTT
jgi:hypothetical protein